jgi:hypothetical protein
MGRKQTRRSISVKGLTYQWIYDYCAKCDPPKSISGFIEDIVKDKLTAERVRFPTEITNRAPGKKRNEDEAPLGNHFTF